MTPAHRPTGGGQRTSGGRETMADEVVEERGVAAGDGSVGRNLPVAIAVGVLLAGLLIGSLLWHPLAFTLVVAGLAAVGLVETARTLGREGRPVSLPVLLVTLLVTVAGAYRAGAAGQVVGIAVLFGGAVAWELAAPDRRDVWRTLATTAFLGIWVCFLASFAVLLVVRPDDGAVAVLAVAGGAIFGDIGGYAFGSLFGRWLIAPTISPKKTWEGLIGGLALTGVVAWFVLPLLGGAFADDPVAGLLVAVSSALAGFFGDLTESMMKRDLGVKDLGHVLPGHGGILDRVDGILLALPVGYYALVLLS